MTMSIEEVFTVFAVAFVALGIGAMYRVIRGPTTYDRVIGVNAVGTTTVLIIVVFSVSLDEPMFLDVAVVYGLLNFVMSIAVSKFGVEWGDVL
ncbi:cation:proton antiporter [Halorutilales archaeon Cl-col2-1]